MGRSPPFVLLDDRGGVTITIDRRIAGDIRKAPGSIVLQVRGAADRDAAMGALQSAAKDIVDMDGGWSLPPA